MLFMVFLQGININEMATSGAELEPSLISLVSARLVGQLRVGARQAGILAPLRRHLPEFGHTGNHLAHLSGLAKMDNHTFGWAQPQ